MDTSTPAPHIPRNMETALYGVLLQYSVLANLPVGRETKSNHEKKKKKKKVLRTYLITAYLKSQGLTTLDPATQLIHQNLGQVLL